MKYFFEREIGQNTLSSILKLLNIEHTNKYTNKYFNEHPHKYNMLGLSKMLSHYGVNNIGIRVEDKNEDIHDLETPFIAHTGSGFMVVEAISKEEVTYHWNAKRVKMLMTEFINVWSGATLIVEADENSREPNYIEHRKDKLTSGVKKSILLLTIIGLVTIGFIQNQIYQSIGLSILLLLNLIGIYIGYLLVLKQVKIHSNQADKICSLFAKNDCNDVLESPAAKFMGIISWSELGFSYFLSNTFILLFAPKLLFYFVFLNICALLYSFWSIWYQKFKARTWCPLCLIVQALFWGLFIISFLFRFIKLPNFSAIEVFSVILIYAIPFLIMNLALPILTGGQKIENVTQDFNSLKMNQNVFLALLKEQPRYEINRNTSNILFGNPESKNRLIIFTNPHCEPCARMHIRIERLLNEIGNKFCIQYILSSFNNELESSNEFFIYINNNKSWEVRNRIYTEWFARGKYEKEEFFKKYNFVPNTISEEYKCHKLWKEKTKLIETPTIMLNGIKLPQVYFQQIEDLQYFTDLDIDL